MYSDNTSSISEPETQALLEREERLGELHFIEELLEAARGDIAWHCAACIAAERTGILASEQLEGAESAAEGIQEFRDRMARVEADALGKSAITDEELQRMSWALAALGSQIDGVVERLRGMTDARSLRKAS